MVQSHHYGIRLLVVLATGAMLCPPTVLAGNPAQVQVDTKVIDVKLSPQNLLQGTTVTSEGVAQTGALLTLAQANKALATGQTNEQGRFAFRLAKGGVYQLAVGKRVMLIRAWSAEQAPPAATSELLVVSQAELVRGQRPLGEALFSTPVLIGVVIAAAVAIPLALNSDDDPSGS